MGGGAVGWRALKVWPFGYGDDVVDLKRLRCLGWCVVVDGLLAEMARAVLGFAGRLEGALPGSPAAVGGALHLDILVVAGRPDAVEVEALVAGNAAGAVVGWVQAVADAQSLGGA
jgi:hypothetical protein